MIARPIVLIVEPIVPNCDRVLSDAPTSEAVRCRLRESLTASEVLGIEHIVEHKCSVASKAGIGEEVIACAFSSLPVVALDVRVSKQSNVSVNGLRDQ
jgi:hypothetical protein